MTSCADEIEDNALDMDGDVAKVHAVYMMTVSNVGRGSCNGHHVPMVHVQKVGNLDTNSPKNDYVIVDVTKKGPLEVRPNKAPSRTGSSRENEEPVDMCKWSSCSNLCFVLGITLACWLMLGWPITMMALGLGWARDCPVNGGITMALSISSFMWIVLTYVVIRSVAAIPDTICAALPPWIIFSVLFASHAYLVYPVYNDVQYTDPAASDYCTRSVYQFALFSTTSMGVIALALTLLGLGHAFHQLFRCLRRSAEG